MSWALAFLGFAALVILHEAGHFFAAKAVGMRVERFSLFFPPLVARYKRGETEYAIGAIPLGGYVKITGMNPAEEIPPEHAHRAYYRQPVWKRIVVIAAGPAVNIALAFVILAAVYVDQRHGRAAAGRRRDRAGHARGQGAQEGRRARRRRRQADHRRHATPSRSTRSARRSAPTRARRSRSPCAATAQEQTVTGNTFYDKKLKRYRFGFGYDQEASVQPAGPIRASGLAVSQMWTVTTDTVSHIAQIFVPEKRKELGSVVGGYETTRQAIQLDATTAFVVLAFISLSLGIINLFPFLPLDGGHIFWALAEKVRGKAIPFSVMERAGFVGFALVIALFLVGLTNDLDRIANGGFRLR